MQDYPWKNRNMSPVPPQRWVWDEETLEFVRPLAIEKPVGRRCSGTFNDIVQKAEWLAEMPTLAYRGRQSTRKSLNSAHLTAYRSMVMQRQGDHVTIEDVKQVAVSLLQDNYPIPIPSCFLTILTSKALDEVLSALLLYMACFFEHRSLENKANPLMALDPSKGNQIMARSLAVKDLAQKKLAVRYFTLIMDLEMGQNRHTSYHKGRVSSENTEWRLEACLYTFFCYVAWVAFGRTDLQDIHVEIGRLLYSDVFNSAVRNRSDGYGRRTSSVMNGSAKATGADPKETERNSTSTQRSSHRRPALSSVVNQCSPLMMSLLPSPKQQSPHLFQLGSERLWRAKGYGAQVRMEELNQQMATISIGILGRPLNQLNPTTLIPYGEQRNYSDQDKSLNATQPSTVTPPPSLTDFHVCVVKQTGRQRRAWVCVTHKVSDKGTDSDAL